MEDPREGLAERALVMPDPANIVPPPADPPPREVTPQDYPGMFVELREDEIAAAFPGGLPEQGCIYGLVCYEVMKGEGDTAGNIGVGFRYIKLGELKQRPGSSLILPR